MSSRTPSRRALLLGGVGALTVSAGCISDLESESPPSRSEADDDGDDDTPGGDDGDESSDETNAETGNDELAYEVQRYNRSETPTDPTVTLLDARDDAEDWLAEHGLEGESEGGNDDEAAREGETASEDDSDDEIDEIDEIDPDEPDADGAADAVALGEFVADTVFEDASLIALEADAPNLCYELVLEDVSFESDDGDGGSEPDGTAAGTLELEAAVSDESDEDELCAQVMTTVGLLVRVSVGGRPIGEVSARIIDDDGSEHGLGVASASDADSATASDTADDDADVDE